MIFDNFLQINWWHWIIMGLILTLSEIYITGFSIFLFGISAIFIGVVLIFIDLPFFYQIVSWIVISISLLGVWLRLNNHHIDQSNEYKSIKGEVIEKIDSKRYRAYFDLPVLGDRKWIIESDTKLSVGDRVEIEKIYGQIMKVNKIIEKGD